MSKLCPFCWTRQKQICTFSSALLSKTVFDDYDDDLISAVFTNCHHTVLIRLSKFTAGRHYDERVLLRGTDWMYIILNYEKNEIPCFNGTECNYICKIYPHYLIPYYYKNRT